MNLQSVQVEKISFSPSELRKREHGCIICYPGTNLESFDFRVDQLGTLGVRKLILEGSSKVGKYGIIGRGCVSTVVKARLSSRDEIVALKIRRVDANRTDMKRDYELQQFANSFGVGPRAIAASEDLFAMEYIDSIRLGRWFEHLKTRTPKKYTRALIRDALEQCYLLDTNGLDHGELSNPTKHLLIRNSPNPESVIIDYESASRDRRVANLTAVTQFFFLGGWQSEKIRKILGISKFSKNKFITLLRDYKKDPNKDSMEKILAFVRC
jgi:putative serine/threonine protein kinase